MVDFETTLYEILKSKKNEGRKSKRQYSIGSYIVDFHCPSDQPPRPQPAFAIL
ncbi:MAG TPA: hypothetical protein DDY34_13575 [Bacteroidales bacterium]|nr:hypothetical protein [Bacteroidales bacterium]HBQ82210.1 hypothetical protein [Bacteroidales bacterium]HBQ83550.1 hypothetical protein [Bacteroidales bacterium]